MNGIFHDDRHERRFYYMLEQDRTDTEDRERISMFYILSGNDELYSHVCEIYNYQTHRLRQNPLHKLGYMCSSSQKLLRLSMHLYNAAGSRQTPVELLSSLDRENLDLALNGMRLRFT